jgi:uncharacterized protein (DUF1015 family)
MADIRPFRALRYTALADPALAIAPPYDVISPDDQAALYERSPHNVVRIEYGVQRETDTPADSRYTRAAADLARWREGGVLAVDDLAAMYSYTQEFEWDAQRYRRQAFFCALRLQPWEAGAVKPHEHTLSRPKADRLELLRTTNTQISPVYGLYRANGGPPGPGGELLYDFVADGQRHTVNATTDDAEIEAFRRLIAEADVYIADGHHRYETALAYRDEARAGAASWTGDEPENFVLMALTAHDDPGLVVLPTHRIVHRPPAGDVTLKDAFSREPAGDAVEALRRMHDVAAGGGSAFGSVERGGGVSVLVLGDRAAVEARMPRAQSAAWKRLDVNVLQYGVLQPLFGIDDAALAAGGAVTYTQDATDAQRAVAARDAACAFLLNATPVAQVLDVADAGGRMPQKSTYFYPKLPTGLVMRALE